MFTKRCIFCALAIATLLIQPAFAEKSHCSSHHHHKRKKCCAKICDQTNVVATTFLDGRTTTLEVPKCQNPFHGWWAKVDKGILGGFGSDFNTFAQIGSEDIDAYIFIDTTQDPIVITTMGGNGKDFRSPKPNEVADRPTYYQKNATTLLSTLPKNPGDPLTELFGKAFDSLKLQSDGNLIALTDQGTRKAHGGVVPTYEGDYLAVGIYKKISALDLPAPFPRYDELDYRPVDYTLPTNLARYIFNRLLYHGIARGGEGTSENWNPDFIGFYEAHALFDAYLTTGVTYTTDINKTRTTKNGSGMTSIFTDDFHYAPPGSTVELSGFGGGWAGINGTHVNGVSVHAFGGIPNPNPLFVDVGPGGTWKHYFYLDFDSSGYPQFTANSGYPDFADGSANSTLWGETTPTLSVTHRITDDMEYPAFVAAMTAFFYDAFKVAQHTGQSGWVTEANRRFLADTWDDLQAALDVDEAVIARFRSRTNRFGLSPYYQNPAVKTEFDLDTPPLGNYIWDFNEPYNLLPGVNPLLDYNVDAQNYLVGVSNLYYTLAGTPTKPQHSILGLFGYKNLSGTDAGGAYFIGTVAPMNFADPESGNPDPNVWSLLGVDFDGDPVTSANNFFFGFVNPLLTNGQKVGYIYMPDELRADAFIQMPGIVFTKKEDQNSPRFGLEGYARVWAPLMQYLNTMHPDGPGLDAIIFDDRENGGGLAGQNQVVGSLFGAKRHLSDGARAWWRDNGRRLPEFFVSELGYDAYHNIISLSNQQDAYIYTDQTLQRYGQDAVFSGGKVVVLHNEQGASGGDLILTIAFLGENNDKELGANTQTVFLGSADGRLKGGTWLGYSDCMPLQKYSERLQDSAGNPVSAIPRMRIDIPFLGYVTSINGLKITLQNPEIAIDPAPTLTGGSGGNPLPEEYEQTVYVDFGFMFPHPDAPLPGWVSLHGTAQPDPTDNTTWRDRWLEQAILEAS